MDQPKVERMLQLMMLLTSNHYATVEDIAEWLNMSPRTIYRYIDTFRGAGFVVKKRGKNVFYIDKSSRYFKEISELVHFTEEEAYILKSAIESIDENNLLKQNLKRKLYSVYDYKVIADIVVKNKNRDNIHKLIDAIEEKKQVKLCDYNSAHSNTVNDRIVEPFAFTTNYIQMWCYELESQSVKLFKVSRISKVEILETDWQYELQHKRGFIDIFRIHSNEKKPVKLELTVRAANLLMEEYPLAEQYLTNLDENRWLLNTEVSTFDGIGRFILGLYDEIKIIESPKLERFINDKILEMRRKSLYRDN